MRGCKAHVALWLFGVCGKVLCWYQVDGALEGVIGFGGLVVSEMFIDDNMDVEERSSEAREKRNVDFGTQDLCPRLIL